MQKCGFKKAEVTTFKWMFSCKMSKYSSNTFLEKHLRVTVRIDLFIVKIEKLEQGVKYLQS